MCGIFRMSIFVAYKVENSDFKKTNKIQVLKWRLQVEDKELILGTISTKIPSGYIWEWADHFANQFKVLGYGYGSLERKVD